MVAERAVVTGKVQGVGFRRFVADLAIASGATGFVRNRSDRTVEIFAQFANAEAADRFFAVVSGGPGVVESLVREVENFAADCVDFRIER